MIWVIVVDIIDDHGYVQIVNRIPSYCYARVQLAEWSTRGQTLFWWDSSCPICIFYVYRFDTVVCFYFLFFMVMCWLFFIELIIVYCLLETTRFYISESNTKSHKNLMNFYFLLILMTFEEKMKKYTK